MTSASSALRIYEERLRRAQLLASRHSFARQILTFYESVASFQKNLSTHFANTRKQQPANSAALTDRELLDLTEILPHMRSFFQMVEQKGPPKLADTAQQLASANPESWIMLLNGYWRNGGRAGLVANAFEVFFPRAILQPCAEYFALHFQPPATTETPNCCPLCNAQPLLGILRPEGDSGRRFLVCSFCSHEWGFRRLLCVNCGEETEAKLPVYVAEQLPHIRVEACDTCATYIRTIDLTKDGHAVPLVDDLGAIPLSLWAHEHNFASLQPNLFGT